MKNKYPKEAKLCCPTCDGLGFITLNSANIQIHMKGEKTKEIRNGLRRLKREGKLEGLTLRKIGLFFNITSPQSMKHHLSMVDKKGWENDEV